MELSGGARLLYFMLGVGIGLVLFVTGLWIGWRWGCAEGADQAREEAREAWHRTNYP